MAKAKKKTEGRKKRGTLYVAILSGGIGSRFWPLSRCRFTCPCVVSNGMIAMPSRVCESVTSLAVLERYCQLHINVSARFTNSTEEIRGYFTPR